MEAAADPRKAFNKTLINLVHGLEQHLSPDKAVDNLVYEFFNARLPPYAKDIKKGKKQHFHKYINVSKRPQIQ